MKFFLFFLFYHAIFLLGLLGFVYLTDGVDYEMISYNLWLGIFYAAIGFFSAPFIVKLVNRIPQSTVTGLLLITTTLLVDLNIVGLLGGRLITVEFVRLIIAGAKSESFRILCGIHIDFALSIIISSGLFHRTLFYIDRRK